MKRPEGAFRAVMIFIMFGIVFPIVMYNAVLKGTAAERNYIENGRVVECRVTGVSGNGKSQHVEVTYKDENGERIYANAVVNKRVALDDTFSAYVLKDDPYKVYRPADDALKFILYCLAGLFCITGWLGIIVYIKALADYRLLKNKGEHTGAELISVSEYDGSRVGKFRFVTAGENEYTREFGIKHGYPIVGQSYDILYFERRKGSCAAELIDKELI